MAREFAEWFYKSTMWQQVRDYYYAKQFGICERCGRPGKIVHHKKYLTPKNINNPEVSMGENNLELLCQDCHNKEHMKKNGACSHGFVFDANGDLIEAPRK